MSSQPLPPKKVVALAILEQSKVRLHLDPRADGVVVPPNFKRQPQLLLDIGLNLPVPIPDLYLDDDKITCTLSFGGRPFYCILPWPSIFAMVGDDGRGMVWPESLPPEVVAAQSMPKEAKPKLAAVPPPPPSAAKVEKEEKKKKPAATTKKAAAPAKKAAPAKAEPAKKKTAAKAAKKTAKTEKPKAEPKKVAKPQAKKTAKKAAKSSAPKAPKKAAKKADSKPEAPVVHLPKGGASKGSAPKPEAPRAAQQGKKPAAPAGKPKRELPPYLRVVK